MAVAIPAPLDAGAFPDATPLHAFFAWNEARRAKDRRYIVACDVARLLHGFDYDLCAAHLAGAPLGLRRSGRRILASSTAIERAREFVAAFAGSAAVTAAQPAIDALRAAVGASDPAAHAAVFRAFEELAEHVDLDDLARLRAQRNRSPPMPRRRRILVIKLGALGDFIQALGPVPAIRSHHAGDRLILLTRGRYAELAAQTGLFDDIMVDPRPRPLDVRGWLALRHMLRRQHFDRVYDFQTSDRSNFYPWLLRPGKTPQWSGTAWRCSHPHANRGRDRQHTMDRQAEQLLMAGIYPVPLTPWLPAAGALPAALEGRRFAMLVPGSSPGRPEKRWPVHALRRAGAAFVAAGLSAGGGGCGRRARARPGDLRRLPDEHRPGRPHRCRRVGCAGTGRGSDCRQRHRGDACRGRRRQSSRRPVLRRLEPGFVRAARRPGPHSGRSPISPILRSRRCSPPSLRAKRRWSNARFDDQKMVNRYGLPTLLPVHQSSKTRRIFAARSE